MMPKRFRFTILGVALVFCLSASLFGCSKENESGATGSKSDPEVAELTKLVRRYSFEKRKLPESVEDLVTAGYIKSVPPAPAGKKYAIDADRAEVIVVKQ